MAASAATLPAVDLPRGVIGPPWETVPRMTAVELSLDPPVLHDCSALAVFDERSGTLVRCKSRKEAELRARIASLKSGGPAPILRGALQLKSGLWYWPIVAERVNACKALDPLNRADRAVIAKGLQRTFLNAARPEETLALEATLDMLIGQPWSAMSPEQVDVVYAEVRAAIASVGTSAAMTEASLKAGATLGDVAVASSKGAGGIPAAFRQADLRAVNRLGSNMPFFISDDYGRRVDIFVEYDALKMLQGGQRLGLDDVVIGRNLNSALAGRVVGRSASYFANLSSISVVRASTFGQLAGYRDAGVARYEIVAVMDGATCNICRYMNGQVFEVANHQAQLARAAANSDPVKGIMGEVPFYREHGGNIHIAPLERGGELGQVVARVEESGVGRDDAPGRFTTVTNPANAGGTLGPPFHGRCRCLTLPVL